MNILALTWILLPWELQSLSVLETSDLQIHLSTPSLPAHVTWKMLLQLCTSHSFYIYQMQIALHRVVSKSYKAASVYIPTNSVWKMLSPVQLFVTPWNSLGQNTGMGSLSLLHGIFPTQGSNPGLHIAGGFFTSWATREAQENSMEWSIFNGVNIYPFSSISSRPRNLTSVSDIAGLFFTRWAIREAPSNALVEKLSQCFWVY